MEKLLLLGGSGFVGQRFLADHQSQFEIVAPTHAELDVTNQDHLQQAVDQIKPSYIIMSAAYANVDKAEQESELAQHLNVIAPTNLANIAVAKNIPLMHISTDYVFGGTQADRPYIETDAVNPVKSVYAETKAQGEQAVLAANKDNLVVRIIMPFSDHYERKLDLGRLTIKNLSEGKLMSGVTDQMINPIWLPDLSQAMNLLVQKRASGIYHLGATSYTTPEQLIHLIAKCFNLDQSLIESTTFADFAATRPALRPQHSWISSEKFVKEFGSGILHSIPEQVELFYKSKPIF